MEKPLLNLDQLENNKKNGEGKKAFICEMCGNTFADEKLLIAKCVPKHWFKMSRMRVWFIYKKSFCVIFVDLKLLKKKPLINIYRQYMKEALSGSPSKYPTLPMFKMWL